VGQAGNTQVGVQVRWEGVWWAGQGCIVCLAAMRLLQGDPGPSAAR